jgi:hypothetical protein
MFTKLGLTGLPLTTVVLTLIFSFMAAAGAEGFMDLAKLTLGAFIGSFVQRQVEQRREADTGQKKPPSGETQLPRAIT